VSFSTGASYDGQWEHDLMHGKGILIEANKEKYDGFFAMNQVCTAINLYLFIYLSILIHCFLSFC
jgi:hypothetical protein